MYSHWMEPRQGLGNNELNETVEAFTLHLNQHRGWDLMYPIILVPVPVSVPVLFSVSIPLQTCMPESITAIITDRVRSTRGGYIFSLCVCPHRGGAGYPIQPAGGVPHPARGGTPVGVPAWGTPLAGGAPAWGTPWQGGAHLGYPPGRGAPAWGTPRPPR